MKSKLILLALCFGVWSGLTAVSEAGTLNHVYYDLNNGADFPTAATGGRFFKLPGSNANYGAGYMFSYGNTVPADAATGYAPGCIFIQTDGVSLATTTFINTGTAASCTFDATTDTSGDAVSINMITGTDAAYAFVDGGTAYMDFDTSGTKIDFNQDLQFNGTTPALKIADNTAASLAVTQGAVPYIEFNTTDNSESIALSQRTTTTDGVASGTAKVIGGRAYSAVSASDNLLASAGGSVENFFAQTYSIPASTLKANSVLKISGYVAVTDFSGADTLIIKVYVGGQALITTTAFDPSATTDFVKFETTLVARAAPGATASCTSMGRWISEDTVGAFVYADVITAPANLATNGALVARVGATWSATTASTNARLEMLNVTIE